MSSPGVVSAEKTVAVRSANAGTMPATAGTSSKNHWEAVGGDYRSSWNTPAKEVLSGQELEFVRRFVPPDAHRVLDIGIGSGRILDVLLEAAPSRQLFGVDLAQSMVDVCATRFAGDHRIAGLAVCDVGAQALPFEGPFDLVTAIRVLKYSATWRDVVQHVAEHLSADGTMLFSMANRRSLNRLSRAYAAPWCATTVGELEVIAARLGLTVGAIEGYGRLPFRLAELARPTWLAAAVSRSETALARILGPRLLARELLVAMTTHDRHPLASPGGRFVVVDRDEATVEKRYLGLVSAAQHQAAEEHQALLALRRVVAAVPGASCPERIELLDGPPPTLRMQQVPGTPLLAFLRRTRLTPQRLDAFGAVAAAVVCAYVDETGEPYRDFQFDNMLYDTAADTVGFVDLGAPDGDQDHLVPQVSPLESSLGNLIGSVIFQSARPRWLLRRRQHRQSMAACAAVIGHVVARDGVDVSVHHLRLAADAAFHRCAYRGTTLQRVWYGTGGFLAASRLHLFGSQFGPLPATGRRSWSGRPGGTKRK